MRLRQFATALHTELTSLGHWFDGSCPATGCCLFGERGGCTWNELDGLTVASTHGSPWNYDTFVPIFFAGHGIKTDSVSRPVTPYDIAPTLSARVGIKPPSGSVGNALAEVVE